MAGILERVAAGEEAAVRACVAEYGDVVWSLALRLLKDRSEAEDAVQDVFVELWRNADRFEPAVASERTFVTMIARRRLYDRLRKRARTVAADAGVDLEAVGTALAADAVERTAEARLAARALARLDRGERDVLVLASHGLSHREIAEHLDVPIGTVKTRARRGLLRVRGWLRAGEAEEVSP